MSSKLKEKIRLIEAKIFCPFCRVQHIDTEKWKTVKWAHHKHLCKLVDGGCGKLFRLEDPENYATHFVGVK